MSTTQLANKSRGPVDPAYWEVVPRYGSAGGPLVYRLTPAGRERAFSVGARVKPGSARALEALDDVGGQGALVTWIGSRGYLTKLGRFGVVWGELILRGLVERVSRDEVRLTADGFRAVDAGRAEQESLLERVIEAGAASSP